MAVAAAHQLQKFHFRVTVSYFYRNSGVSKLCTTVKYLFNLRRHNDNRVEIQFEGRAQPTIDAAPFGKQGVKMCYTTIAQNAKKNYAPLAFSDDEVQSAINKAINYRTKVLNFLLTTFHILDVCKIARVFPLMIPGKPANLGESHTPFYIQYIFRIFCCCFFIIDFLSFEKVFFYIFLLHSIFTLHVFTFIYTLLLVQNYMHQLHHRNCWKTMKKKSG